MTADTIPVAPLSIWKPVHLGTDELDRRVEVTLAERNMLIGGEPGSGKSVALQLIVAHGALSADCRLILVDGKRVELGLWRDCAERFIGPSIDDAGRTRGIDAEATRLRDAFRTQQMRQLPLVEAAMGRQALALLRQLDAACASADDLERAAIESFNQHPDAGIITSFPGLGPIAGARVLAETGDDRSRFQDAKGLKAYAGAAPITRASGKTKTVTRRHITNNRLNAAGYTWAFSALTASPGARAHYDRRHDGDRHAAAQRNLFGRLLGCLHRCLATGQHYDENIAFPATADKLRRAA
jgi:hypothetical protein